MKHIFFLAATSSAASWAWSSFLIEDRDHEEMVSVFFCIPYNILPGFIFSVYFVPLWLIGNTEWIRQNPPPAISWYLAKNRFSREST